jgi:CxxC motif-containing protein (DUF1111 family)
MKCFGESTAKPDTERSVRRAGVGVILLLCYWALPIYAADTEKDLRAELMSAPLTPALGGDTTVDTTGPRAFRSIAANAPNDQIAPFLFGQRIFDVVWDHLPVLQPTLNGLGPTFNRTACRECHEGNGRGRPPESVGAPMKSILVRISVPGEGAHGGPNPVPNYGDQLQDRAVPGVAPEGQAIITYEEIPGEFADGTPYSLRKPTISFVNLAYGDLPANTLASARVAAPVIGLGLLQAIEDETLQALADPDDANGDGISGRMNVVWDAEAKQMAVGRFGWKANVPTIRHQNAGAALGDLGMTSSVFPNNNCEEIQADCQSVADEIASQSDAPEIHPELFDALDLYMLLLAVPRQRDADDEAVQRGELLFRGIGCSGCHMPTMAAGESPRSELSGQVFHPFTDLLLHDMGEGLADNRPDFKATGREWRTAPLWGVGLTYDVGAFNLHLHDGRARSLSEAILWHGGEAEPPRETFRKMSQPQREDLLAFLGSL